MHSGAPGPGGCPPGARVAKLVSLVVFSDGEIEGTSRSSGPVFRVCAHSYENADADGVGVETRTNAFPTVYFAVCNTHFADGEDDQTCKFGDSGTWGAPSWPGCTAVHRPDLPN